MQDISEADIGQAGAGFVDELELHVVPVVLGGGVDTLDPVTELDEVEARIWSLLEPYRGELESATIYGMPSVRWPGAKAHDYFAAVRRGKEYVSLYLVVADAYPEALAGASAALLKRRTGRAAFTFPQLDDELALELQALLARLYGRYRADHEPPS
jgi:hypothetical protein